VDNSLVFLRLRASLTQRKAFWSAREVLATLRFRVLAQLFFARGKAKARTRDLGLLHKIFSENLVGVSLAALVVAILYLIDGALSASALRFTLQELGETGYVDLLAAVAGVGGVFIALYYTAVAAVASSIYSHMPSNVGDLLGQERTGQAYLGYLAFVTSLALFLLSCRAAGLPRPLLAALVLGVFSCFGVYAFLTLGRQAFYLLDPARFSDSVLRDLLRWVDQVTVKGYRWGDPSFQFYAHRQAQITLERLGTLVSVAESAPGLSGRPLLELATAIVTALTIYQNKRSSIPSASHWFSKELQHKDWFTAKDTAVSVAHESSTIPTPETVTKSDWLEDATLPLVLRSLRTLLTHHPFELGYELLNKLGRFCQLVSAQGDTERAFRYTEDVAAVVLDAVTERSSAGRPAVETMRELSLVNRLAGMLVETALGFLDWSEKTSRADVLVRLARIDWRRPASVYRVGLHPYLLPRAEWMFPRIQFEYHSEGRRITPDWYLTELIAQEQAFRLKANVEVVLTGALAAFERWIARLTNLSMDWTAAAVRSKQLEYLRKLGVRLESLKRIWHDLSDDRKVRGIPWPEADPEQWVGSLRGSWTATLKQMAAGAPALLGLHRPDQFPDYGGQFLHETGEAIMAALIGQDSAFVAAAFFLYQACCLRKLQALSPTSQSLDWRGKRRLVMALAPLQDLLNLSGYARLLAEVHENLGLWQEVEAVWQGLLGNQAGNQLASSIAAALWVLKSERTLGHRALIRTQWQIRVNNVMSQLPRKAVYPPGRLSPTEVPVHASALVRYVGSSMFRPSLDGATIFVGTYLCKHPAAANLAWPPTIKEFVESFKRHESMGLEELGEP